MSRYLVVEMLQVVRDLNPEYPADIELDGKPLLKIADFIYKQMKLVRGPENHAYEILPVWEQLYSVVLMDQFYAQKSLSTISTHIQEFYQKLAYGDSKSTKLSSDKLKRKIAAKYSERKKGSNNNASGSL